MATHPDEEHVQPRRRTEVGHGLHDLIHIVRAALGDQQLQLGHCLGRQAPQQLQLLCRIDIIERMIQEPGREPLLYLPTGVQVRLYRQATPFAVRNCLGQRQMPQLKNLQRKFT